MPKTVDILIYTPLEEEYDAIAALFCAESDISGTEYDGFTWTLGNVEGATIVGENWGNTNSRKAIMEAGRDLEPSLVICVGIAGSISDDLKLGDVVYSKTVYDLTQRGKLKPGDHTFDAEQLEIDSRLVKSLNRDRRRKTGDATFQLWKENRQREIHSEITASGIHGDAAERLTNLVITPGKIATLNSVVADTATKEAITRSGRKIIAIETESCGGVEACNELDIPYITIRGCSDYADEDKNSLEQASKNFIRKTAAKNAGSFVKYATPILLDSILEDCLSPVSIETPLEACIKNNDLNIKREAQKRFSLYSLDLAAIETFPAPRIRIEAPKEDGSELIADKAEVLEIDEALELSSRVCVKVPRYYPDTSLPFLFANRLNRALIGGKPTYAVNVKWESFGPPSNTLDAFLNELGLGDLSKDDCCIVFVFSEFRTGSSSKTDFLDKCLSENPNYSAIIFPHGDATPDEINTFEETFEFSDASIVSISFREFVSFVMKQYGLPAGQAEVSARRLFNTFDRHRLQLMPAHLVSIDKDVLSLMVSANRRSELIELIVTGMLMTVVAADSSFAKLSRTFREEFLAELAVRIHILKSVKTKGEAISFAESIFQERGIDVSPSSFIKLLVDGGILTETNNIDFRVSLIKSYMIATGLCNHPELAKQYFELNNSIPDIQTFDIYCELDENQTLLEQLEKEVDVSIAYFEGKLSTYDNPILDGHVECRALKGKSNVAEIAVSMGETISKIASANSDDTIDEKQKLIDANNRVRRIKQTVAVDTTDKQRHLPEKHAIRSMYMLTLNLSASAERMTKEAKKENLKKVIQLGDLMVKDIHTIISQTDEVEIAKKIRHLLKEQIEGTIPEDELESFSNLLADDLHASSAMRIYFNVMHLLYEGGHSKILKSLIEEIDANGNIQHLLKSGWITDLDPSNPDNERIFKSLSKKLGAKTLPRFVLADFFAGRSFWYYSTVAEKQQVLKTINEVLKPMFKRMRGPDETQ